MVFSSPQEFPQFVVIHTVKGCSVVGEARVDVFLQFSCFFYDPADVGNLISGSSAFSKSSLNLIITVRQVPWCYTYTLSYVGNTSSWWVYKLVQLLRRVIWRQLCKLKGVFWTAKRSNQWILREINPEYSMERLMLKMKLQYFGHLMRTADSLRKSLMLGKTENRRRRGRQRMRWLYGIINAMYMNLGKLWRWWGTEDSHAIVHGVAKSPTRLGNWTTCKPSLGRAVSLPSWYLLIDFTVPKDTEY